MRNITELLPLFNVTDNLGFPLGQDLTVIENFLQNIWYIPSKLVIGLLLEEISETFVQPVNFCPAFHIIFITRLLNTALVQNNSVEN